MHDDDRQVIDLGRHRAAVKARAKSAAKAKAALARPSRAAKEPLLGARPGAGLILLAVAVVAMALLWGPRFF